MTQVTKEQFANAQERLAQFLADKYAIKNQSKGLMEYGAAFILGYDNHHQLNSLLDQKNTQCEHPISTKTHSDDDIFRIITESNETEEILLDAKLSEGFDIFEINCFVKKQFSIDLLKEENVSGSLTENLILFFNQFVDWDVTLYADKDAFSQRISLEHVNDFTYKSQAEKWISSRVKEGHIDTEKAVVKLQDSTREMVYIIDSPAGFCEIVKSSDKKSIDK